MRFIRPVAAAAVALCAVSSAFAAQTTVEFKTFYDTSTFFNPTDTKTLSNSVATLTLKDLAGGGGVTGTLQFLDTDFPASKTLTIDELWLENSARGKVSATSGAPLKGSFYKHGFYGDGGRYNYDIQYSHGSFAEGSNSSFTITGEGVSVASFLDPSNAKNPLKGITLEVTGVGKPYSGFLGLNRNVHFIGEISIPEPSTYALMGLGLLGVFGAARRRGTV